MRLFSTEQFSERAETGWDEVGGRDVLQPLCVVGSRWPGSAAWSTRPCRTGGYNVFDG